MGSVVIVGVVIFWAALAAVGFVASEVRGHH